MNVSLAQNGKQIALIIEAQGENSSNETGDIWLYDISIRTLTQMTFDGLSSLPQLLHDSNRLTYLRYDPSEKMNDLQCLYLDGSQEEEHLARVSKNFWLGYSMKRDLLCALGVVNLPLDDQDIVEMSLPNGAGDHRTVAGDPSWQRGPVLSPDGNWVAYNSHETGTWEVYVKPYPGSGRKTKITDGGGFEPVWHPNDNKLYYRNADEMWMVTYEVKKTFQPAQPQFLFRYHAYGLLGIQTYAVAGDGRFLMIQEDLDASRQINIVSDWFETLRQLIPTGENRTDD
jgi:Tol biopolymer transport system component